MELIINWFYENSWMLNEESWFLNLFGASTFLIGTYIMLKSFTYPFITKYGSVLHSITRGRKNEKRRSGLFEFIIGFALISLTIIPLIKIALIILFIDGLISFLDSGRDRM